LKMAVSFNSKIAISIQFNMRVGVGKRKKGEERDHPLFTAPVRFFGEWQEKHLPLAQPFHPQLITFARKTYKKPLGPSNLPWVAERKAKILP